MAGAANAMTASRVFLSVVVPCFNEAVVIRATHARLGTVLASIDGDGEIIYVDDGSRDGTLPILRELQVGDARVRLVSLSRNFGHQLAVTAGIDRALGQVVVLIDADLQDPPEVIVEMVAKWREGYQVVSGRRTERDGESVFKLATAKLFYRVLNHFSNVPIPLDTGDFRLMDRRVVDTLKAMPERDRFVRGMVAWVGFRQFALPYRRQPRLAGTSKYPLRRMLSFALDGILSFSITPLRAATGIGLVASAMALLGIGYAVVMRLFTNDWVPGWTLLMIAVLFMGGVQLLCLGIIGEYIGRIYNESKRRPLYLVDEESGFPPAAPQSVGVAAMVSA